MVCCHPLCCPPTIAYAALFLGHSILSKAVGEPPKLWFLIPVCINQPTSLNLVLIVTTQLAGGEDNLLLEPRAPTNLVPSRPSFVRAYEGMPLQDTFSTVAMDQDKHQLAVGWSSHLCCF
jgi:hypothetical protein